MVLGVLFGTAVTVVTGLILVELLMDAITPDITEHDRDLPSTTSSEPDPDEVTSDAWVDLEDYR